MPLSSGKFDKAALYFGKQRRWVQLSARIPLLPEIIHVHVFRFTRPTNIVL